MESQEKRGVVVVRLDARVWRPLHATRRLPALGRSGLGNTLNAILGVWHRRQKQPRETEPDRLLIVCQCNRTRD